ncbi:hypothetical protein GCM10028895_19860 [Pontibacter rugosus]
MMFSVVISTFNRQELVLRAISSVISQTYVHWELIISDDCSTDDTISLLKVKYGSYPNIKIVSTKANGGNALARNLGIDNAKGEYICFLDSDDTYESTFLENMLELINKNSKPGFLWSNVRHIGLNGNFNNNVFPKSWKPLEVENPYLLFLKGLKFGTDFGFTLKKDVVDVVGYFDENLRTAVDKDYILRLAKANITFSYTDKVLVNTYDHSGMRVRRNLAEKIRSYKTIIHKHPAINESVEIHDIWFYKLAWMSYQYGNKREAREFLKKLKLLILELRHYPSYMNFYLLSLH